MPSLSLPLACRAPTHAFPARSGCLVLPAVLLGNCGKSQPSNNAATAPARMAADGVAGRSGGSTVARFQIEANDCLHSPPYTATCKAKQS